MFHCVNYVQSHCCARAFGVSFFDKVHNQAVVVHIIAAYAAILHQNDNAFFDCIEDDRHKLLNE